MGAGSIDSDLAYPVFMDARFGLHYDENANHMTGKDIYTLWSFIIEKNMIWEIWDFEIFCPQ